MSDPVKLHLVRHGETALNKEKRFRGRADAPLNEQGKLEAAGAGRLLSTRANLARIYSSPVERAVQTATAIAINTGARMETDDDFIDIDYGEWQGLTVEEVGEKYPAGIEAWRNDPGSFTFPGGDSIASVAGRIGPAFDRLLRSAGDGEIALVTHLAIIRLSFCILMDLEIDWFWKVNLDNGSTSTFSWTPERGYVLERWGEPPF